MSGKLFTTKNIAGMSVFVALSFVLSLPVFEIPIFPGTPYKLDFSNVFVLLGGFMYGPVGGVIILFAEQLLHLTVGSTGGVGELANVIMGLAFILLPTIIYRYKKGIKVVLATLLAACILQTVAGVLTNKWILLPFFHVSEYFDDWFWIIVGFNLIKSASVSVIALLFYKKLSGLFKKINLQSSPEDDKIESGDDKSENDGEKNKMKHLSNSEEETENIAKKFAETLKKGDVVILKGELGAGKTAFVKGVAAYFGIDGVVSPTYAYLNVYDGLLYHYDCYRLSSGEEAELLGLTDYFNGDNICLIEWAENIESVLPEGCKTVTIEKTGENSRSIEL